MLRSEAPDYRNLTTILGRMPDGYLHILAKGNNEFDQPINSKVGQPVVLQRGNRLLGDPENFGSFHLGKIPFLDDATDLDYQLRLH